MYRAASRNEQQRLLSARQYDRIEKPLIPSHELHLPLIGGATRNMARAASINFLDPIIMLGPTLRCVMDGVSWTDLDPDEQRAIALLGAGVLLNYATASLS
jgi:hypothetical protein